MPIYGCERIVAITSVVVEAAEEVEVVVVIIVIGKTETSKMGK